MSTNLPEAQTVSDSSQEVRGFFNRYFTQQITFPSNEIDAVIGFFMKRGFDEQSSKSTAIVLLNQAKLDQVNVFKLLDTIKGLTNAQLSSVVTEILNSSREKSSTLGFKILTIEETTESRNIRS